MDEAMTEREKERNN